MQLHIRLFDENVTSPFWPAGNGSLRPTALVCRYQDNDKKWFLLLKLLNKKILFQFGMRELGIFLKHLDLDISKNLRCGEEISAPLNTQYLKIVQEVILSSLKV